MKTHTILMTDSLYHLKQDCNKKIVLLNRDKISEVIRNDIGESDYKDAQQRMHNAAERLVRRIARNLNHSASFNLESFAQALYFPVLTEISTISPVRKAARILKKRHAGECLVVQMQNEAMSPFSGWHSNQLLELFLVEELAKRGAEVFILLSDAKSTNVLEIRPREKFINADIYTYQGSAICNKHLRASRMVFSEVFESNWKIGEKHRWNLSKQRSKPPSFKINFLPAPYSMDDKILSARINFSNIWKYLLGWLADQVYNAHVDITRMVIDKQITQAHVSQAASPESAVLVGSVLSCGGDFTLWPHSINNTGLSLYRKILPKKIIQVVDQPQLIGCDHIPQDLFFTRSDLMLQKPVGNHSLIENKPLNVIIIGTAHVLGETPVVNYSKHIDTYRRLIFGLRRRSPGVRVFIRPKGIHESLEWFRSILNTDIQESPGGPSTIELPNMIFLNVTYASSAIYEGASRGIPSAIVREFPVKDYIPFDERYFPVKSVCETLEMIDGLADSDVLSGMRQRQAEWVTERTLFSNEYSECLGTLAFKSLAQRVFDRLQRLM